MQRVLALMVLSALFSCTRTAIPTPPVPPTPALSLSVTEYKPHVQRLVTDISYDADQWPASIRIHSFDTLGGIGYRDTALINFQRSAGSANPPTSYDITWLIGTAPPDFGATEHHLLYYDNQSRIIKDSTSQTTGLDLASNIFIYNGNLITIQRYSYAASVPGSWLMYEDDTLNLSSGNIGGYISYYNGGAAPAFTGFDDYVSSDFDNPLYQSAVATSLGPLFRSDYVGYNFIGDFLSPKLMSQWGSMPAPNQPVTTLNYTWTTDSDGRVVQGSGMEVNGGGPEDIFTFDYH